MVYARSTLIPVLQRCCRRQSSQVADLRDRGRDGGTHWRRDDSGLNQARTRNVRVAQQGSEAFMEQRRPQEPAVMCGQEGRNAARASYTQRRHKKSRRRSSDRQRTGRRRAGLRTEPDCTDVKQGGARRGEDDVRAIITVSRCAAAHAVSCFKMTPEPA